MEKTIFEQMGGTYHKELSQTLPYRPKKKSPSRYGGSGTNST